jgi:hypothetical protein
MRELLRIEDCIKGDIGNVFMCSFSKELLKEYIGMPAVLVMGLPGNGKTFYLNHLPNAKYIPRITSQSFIIEEKNSCIDNVENVVLTAEYWVPFIEKEHFINVVNYLSEVKKKHVYIHCQPRDFEWLKEIFVKSK